MKNNSKQIVVSQTSWTILTVIYLILLLLYQKVLSNFIVSININALHYLPHSSSEQVTL